jgi:putative transposase
MDDAETLAHTTWECKYHVVFIPKYPRKLLYGQLRRELGQVFRRLAEQKECRVEDGHLMSDHVHMLVSIPPEHAVSQVVGFLRGKSAIHIARTYLGRRQNYTGQHFWARGYFVSTVGRDAAAVREYIQKQELEDKRSDQLSMWKSEPPVGGSLLGSLHRGHPVSHVPGRRHRDTGQRAPHSPRQSGDEADRGQVSRAARRLITASCPARRRP